ncbi:signal peptidase I [Nocardioides albertanoniae]|uniref:Signal peptidase I n=1 Tax=Nocardioides albertanoniae TaxID=1175486 RepID=A0A543AA44_9ACTN|nr:signal peptidase I [Nocardioides albertanoniae]TQL69380.1 signal peptidase I [Nocardioides albertanoniae]
MTSNDRDPSVGARPQANWNRPEMEGSRSFFSSEQAPRWAPEEQGRRGGSRREQERKPRLSAWQEGIVLVVLAVLVAIVVKAFFVQAFYIPSESMEPGLQGGPTVSTDDRVLVEKPSYWLSGTPKRGDVVVFSDPGSWLGVAEGGGPDNLLGKGLSVIGLYPEGGHLVKRVIGVPGDVVECCDKQGRMMVNGVAIDEPYARPSRTKCGRPNKDGECFGPMPGSRHWKSERVPEGSLFVMGDNRSNSADSTVHMCTAEETDCALVPWVPEDNVVGKVVALGWPLNRAKWIHRPDSFEAVPSR